MADNLFEAKKVEDGLLNRLDLHLQYAFNHGVNFRDRVINLTSEIDDTTFRHFSAAMSELEKVNKKRITILINCPGGSVYDALAIVGRIRSSKCNIITEIYGHCMSAATLIAASGHTRRMSKYGTFMCHQTFYSIEGRHKDNQIATLQQEREERNWANWLASFSKADEVYWYEIVKHGDKYFSPEECLELGLIDEII